MRKKIDEEAKLRAEEEFERRKAEAQARIRADEETRRKAAAGAKPREEAPAQKMKEEAPPAEDAGRPFRRRDEGGLLQMAYLIKLQQDSKTLAKDKPRQPLHQKITVPSPGLQPSGARPLNQPQRGSSPAEVIMNHPDGGKYVGGWSAGMAEGDGILSSPDGSKYMGQWRQGKKNGVGILITADGKRIVGTWKNDEYVEKAHGQD